MDEYASDSRISTNANRVEILTRTERHRRWSDPEKQRILQETLEPGATVIGVAKRHGLSTGQIYTWRRQALAGAVGGFVPVVIGPSEASVTGGEPAMRTPHAGSVELETAGVIIRVAPDVDLAFLSAVLRAVKAA